MAVVVRTADVSLCAAAAAPPPPLSAMASDAGVRRFRTHVQTAFRRLRQTHSRDAPTSNPTIEQFQPDIYADNLCTVRNWFDSLLSKDNNLCTLDCRAAVSVLHRTHETVKKVRFRRL